MDNKVLMQKKGIFKIDDLHLQKLVFMFPGNGSLKRNSFTDFQNDTFSYWWEKGEHIYKEKTGKDLNVYNDDTENLDALQTAIFVSSYAMYKLYEKKGIIPDIVMGHSLGEITAYAAAGIISFDDGIDICIKRSQLLETNFKEKGKMLSLNLKNKEDFQSIVEFIGNSNINNVKAAIENTKSDFIFSGSNKDVYKLEKYCQENDIKYVDPKINYAYHTGLLSEIVNKLEVYFANLTFSFPKLDVYSPILGRFINQNDVGNMAHILSVELIKPFSFRKSIEKLYNENEANVYVECGPGHILANYVNKILNRSFIAINSNEPGKRSNITFDNTYLLLDFLKKQKEMCFVGKDNTINEIEKLTGYPQKLILQLLESPTIDNKLFAVPNNIFNKIQLLLDKEDNNQFRQKNVVNVKDTNIKNKVVNVISSETGYPKEMLDIDADLEADLGIDSVKLGEILSRLAAESGIELSDDQQIHTIGDIIKGYKGQNNNESVKEEEETNRKENNDNKDIQARIIEIISDETGYPKEVLDTDADLEADLGIDSVKLGEILSRLAAESGIELSDNQQIHTIHDILKQCVSREDCSVEKNTECNASIHRYAAEKVEYPLKKENNIDISSFNVLLIGSEKYSLLTKKVYQKLRLKVKNILYIDGNKLHQTRNIKEFLYREFETSKFKCNAIVNLSSLDTNDDLNESFEEWNLNDDLLYETLFYSVKYYYNDLAANGYLISIVSTDNSFGISNNNIYSPSLGIVTGFTKGLEKELRPFKAKVIGTSLKEDVSSLILEEFNKFGNAIEISYENEKRYKLITIPQKLKQESENIMVGENDTVLATGGGKGITYELLKRLCEVTDCNAVIIGRSDFPDGNEKWLTDNSNELEAWKKEFLLSERKKNPDKPLTEITFEIDRLIKSRDLYKNINNLRKQGFNIEYMKCDISKEYDVKKVSDKLREKKIQITGIINGAGLPSFGKLPNKNEKLAKKVVTVKANSLYLINKYFLNDKVKFLFSMGSISGRFGMDGQTDYSAGADVLVKISKLLAYKYPKLNCKVIGWPAWEKVGMASNPEVIKVQKEERGLDYISINEGQDFFIDELMNFDKNVEFLYFGKLGKLNMPLGQLDNVDLKKANLINEIIDGNVINKNEYPLVEKEKAKFNDGIEVSWNLNKNAEFLNDHRIRKNKVLAGVYQVEFALETCKLYCENHGIIFKNWTIDQFEFINFVKVFERNVELRTQVHVQNVGNKILFEGNIISDFVNKNGYCLIKDKIFSTFKISLDKNEKVNVLDMMEKSQVLTTKSNINLTNYYDKLDNFIHFGKGFRCLKEVINEGKMATGIVKVCDEALEINRESTNMIINPILVDNMGRLMLINEFEASGYSIVPISLHGVRKVGNFVKNNEVYAKVIKIANSEKDCEYKAVIESKDGTVLFKVDNMRLAKIDQITND